MSHYFVTPEHDEARHEVKATIWERPLTFTSAPGIFSSHRLDLGTKVLLDKADLPDPGAKRLLDLGCGFGPIAISLALECPEAEVDAVDVNALARQVTAENAERHQVADRVHTREGDYAPDYLYDEIWSNPPIRIGKEALHELLLTWLARLAPDGCAWLVVSKNLGGDSLASWLAGQGFPCQKMASAKGYRVLRVTREGAENLSEK